MLHNILPVTASWPMSSTCRFNDKSVAATLDAYAVSSGADLTVMGGFGHSRFREFILGGVTRELSASTSVPLLLSH